MLWKRTSLLALCLGTEMATGQTPAGSGVDRWIHQALEENREILAARQRVAEARALVKQANLRPAPSLEINGLSGRPLGTVGEEEFSAGYSQTVESGGKRSKRVTAAGHAVALAEAELADRGRVLAYDIKLKYIDAVTSRRKTGALDQISSVNRESYRLMDERVKRDDAAPLERQLLLVELNRTEAQRAAMQGQTLAALAELRRTSGVALDDEVTDPPAATVALTLTELRKRSLENRPDLRVASAALAQSTAETALADAQSRPDITWSAGYTRRTGQFEDPIRNTAAGAPLVLQDRDNVVSVGLSIPLQSRKRNQGNLEAAVARERAARLKRDQLELTIPLEVEAAFNRYQAARQAAGMWASSVVSESEKNLAVIRQAYELGQLRLLDVLNEQRRVLENRMALIDAEAELARSVAELERATGGELK